MAKKKKKAAKKVVNKATKKANKKVTKKVAKKAEKRVTKKVNKKANKKSTKKPTKKSSAKKTNKKASSPKASIEQLQALLQDNLNGLNTDKAEAIAKKIWLAGLGAYSKTFDELSERVDDFQERYQSINKEGQKVFEDLVDQGVSMQGDIDKAIQQGKASLEERVEDFKERFGGGLTSMVDIPERLKEAAERIEKISKKLKK